MGLTAKQWDELPPILTAEQVAAVVGVRPAQVLRWANAGTFPARKISGQWRFPKSAIVNGPASDDSSGADRDSDSAGGR